MIDLEDFKLCAVSADNDSCFERAVEIFLSAINIGLVGIGTIGSIIALLCSFTPVYAGTCCYDPTYYYGNQFAGCYAGLNCKCEGVCLDESSRCSGILAQNTECSYVRQLGCKPGCNGDAFYDDCGDQFVIPYKPGFKIIASFRTAPPYCWGYAAISSGGTPAVRSSTANSRCNPSPSTPSEVVCSDSFVAVAFTDYDKLLGSPDANGDSYASCDFAEVYVRYVPISSSDEPYEPTLDDATKMCKNPSVVPQTITIPLPNNSPQEMTCNPENPLAVILTSSKSNKRDIGESISYKFNVVNTTGTWDQGDAIVLCNDIEQGNGTNIMVVGNEISCPPGANFTLFIPGNQWDGQNSSMSVSSSASSLATTSPTAKISITKLSNSGKSDSSGSDSSSETHYKQSSSSDASGSHGTYVAPANTQNSNQWWPWVTGTVVGVGGAIATTAVLVHKCRHHHNVETNEIPLK